MTTKPATKGNETTSIWILILAFCFYCLSISHFKECSRTVMIVNNVRSLYITITISCQKSLYSNYSLKQLVGNLLFYRYLPFLAFIRMFLYVFTLNQLFFWSQCFPFNDYWKIDLIKHFVEFRIISQMNCIAARITAQDIQIKF